MSSCSPTRVLRVTTMPEVVGSACDCPKHVLLPGQCEDTCAHMQACRVCRHARGARARMGWTRSGGRGIVVSAGLITPVGRAALSSLGDRWPSAQRDPSADCKSGKVGNPLQQGRRHGPQVTQRCASASFIGRTERECERKQVRDRRTRQYTDQPADTLAPEAPHVISFHPPDSPGRSATPIRLSNLSPDPQLGAGARSQLCMLGPAL